MAKLMVICVPPDSRSERYTVVLGDCILPGHVLGEYDSEDAADEACEKFAAHYNLRAYPLFMPWKKRPAFILIQGGLTKPLPT